MFGVVYIADGRIQIRELPFPWFPKKTKPFVKGLSLSLPAADGTYEASYTPGADMELLTVAVACSGYAADDYWELWVGSERICETIYLKELPESVGMGSPWAVVFPVPAGTPVSFRFRNASATAKRVWVNFHFLR